MYLVRVVEVGVPGGRYINHDRRGNEIAVGKGGVSGFNPPTKNRNTLLTSLCDEDHIIAYRNIA